ncbi:MAG: DUF5919 domain-containing protein [Solirubrobacterales bacterium]
MKEDPLFRDLEGIFAAGFFDFSAESLTTLPTLLGKEGSPADSDAVRRKVMRLLMWDEPKKDPADFASLGQYTRFALTLFGATQESRLLTMMGRREAAGAIYRAGGMSADGVRRRPSKKQPGGGPEWRLLKAMRERLSETDPTGLGDSLAADFFVEGYVQNSPRFRQALISCRSLSLLGFSHNRMVVTYAAELTHLVERGGRLRVLALDPSKPIVLDANRRSYTPKKADAVRHQHEAAIAALTAIGERATDPENFQICLMDCTPPFTIYLFDEEDGGRAQVFVWLTPWRLPSPERPGFSLRADNDGAWYAFFADQLKAMWKHFEGSP